MHEEPNIGIQVSPADIGRYQEQIVVMNPDHLPLLFELSDYLGKLRVHRLVLLPQLLLAEVVLEVIQALEVVEEGSQHGLMEVQELANGFILKEDRDAAIGFEDLRDLVFLSLTLCDDARPPDPDDLHHLTLFSQLKHGRVEHGF